jgi:putative flippase GtrA
MMRLPKFVVIGGICALLNTVLVVALASHGFNYIKASCLAFGPVLCVGYTLHTIFTFETSASWRAFARYSLVMLTNYPMWIGSLYILCDLLDFSVAIAAPVTTGLLFLWNYISAKWALRTVTPNLLVNASHRQPRV